jgi:hypothetical protein
MREWFVLLIRPTPKPPLVTRDCARSCQLNFLQSNPAQPEVNSEKGKPGRGFRGFTAASIRRTVGLMLRIMHRRRDGAIDLQLKVFLTHVQVVVDMHDEMVGVSAHATLTLNLTIMSIGSAVQKCLNLGTWEGGVKPHRLKITATASRVP